MKYSNEPPPNYETLRQLFPVNFYESAVFTYGDTCHCHNGFLPDFVVPHEEVHVRQQTAMGAKEWWAKFIADPEFRLEQELEAYRVQYKWVLKHIKGRQQQFEFLRKFATDLSVRYGLTIGFNAALQQIRV